MNARTSTNGRRPARRKPDLVPPATERLERSILGGIADDPPLYGVAAALGLRPEHFSLSAHRTIFECMTNVAEQGERVELPAILRELERQGQLEAVGDVAYLSALSDGVVASASSLERDINRLLEHQLLRDFCRTAEEWSERACQSGVKISDLVNAAKGKLFTLENAIAGRRHLHKTAGALDGGSLLNRVGAFIDRYVLLKPAQRDVVALWVMHTHTFDAADATGYLAVVSAEKRSGKTRLLEVVAPLVAKAWFTARVSPAVLARKIDAEAPTLLLDESDAAFKGDKEYAEVLRGILNSGHRRGGVTTSRVPSLTLGIATCLKLPPVLSYRLLNRNTRHKTVSMRVRNTFPTCNKRPALRFREVENRQYP